MKKIISLLLFLFLLTGMSYAQDAAKDFKTKSISLFKNGSAFYLKSGKVKTQNSIYRITENIPSALFGTFWIQSPTGELDFVSSYTDQIVESTKDRPISFPQMLSANLGKMIRLHIGKDEVVEGIVEEVEEIKVANDEQALIPEQFLITNMLTLKTDSLWMTISTAEIRRIEFLEKPSQVLETKAIQTKPVISFDFANEKPEQNIEIMYLQNGLSWTPGYLIELIDDTNAQLTLRAEVVNNAEDIKNTAINFVVGVPNFRFANKLSSLVDFYNTYVPAINPGFSNALQAQTTNSYAIQEDVSFLEIGGMADEVTGSAEEDLFFYNLKNFTLKKGGRGHYPIFNKKINIAHIYECNLSANNANQSYFLDSFSFSPDNINKVVHAVKINNDTEFPWTTGVAMVVKGLKDQKPISQDQLNYTPINGHSFIKLTEAPDVKVKHAEKETDRQDRVMKNPQNKNYYLDLVTVEGQLKIKNYKAKKIDLNIRRTITGELISTSSPWLQSSLVNRNGQNKVTNVCWETSIGAGEELTINYQYEVYVPD